VRRRRKKKRGKGKGKEKGRRREGRGGVGEAEIQEVVQVCCPDVVEPGLKFRPFYLRSGTSFPLTALLSVLSEARASPSHSFFFSPE
jgi:hypothetical protein